MHCASLLSGCLLLCLLHPATATAAERTVGPGKMYASPSQAAAVAAAGDIISIDAGTYVGDVCRWAADDLTIRSVGGRARLEAHGAAYGGKGIWVVAGHRTTISGMEFTGASVPDANGAGIRQEGDGLTVRDCYFHHNENGILSGASASSDIVIEHCEFAYNGSGDGYSHNLYIGHVRSLVFRYNYSHHAVVGHALKSRAERNLIACNRLMDEASGTSSYNVDLPNGGLAFIIGNLIQQGPASANGGIIAYGLEGGSSPEQRLYLINNTVVNDRSGGVFLALGAATTLARIENNILLGSGTTTSGPGTLLASNLITTTSPLQDRAGYDYHLRAGTAAIDAGSVPGSADGQLLLPTQQYAHVADVMARTTLGPAPDIGAYEYDPGDAPPVITSVLASPDPVVGMSASLVASASDDGGAAALQYSWSSTGPAAVAFAPNDSHAASTATATFAQAGIYQITVRVTDGTGHSSTALVEVTVEASPATNGSAPAGSSGGCGSGAMLGVLLAMLLVSAGLSAARWRGCGNRSAWMRCALARGRPGGNPPDHHPRHHP